MSMTVRRKADSKVPHVFLHKVADIRGGVSVDTSELGGDFLPEGAVLSKPKDGICHVVKVAKVVAEVAETDTEITVQKFHNFKVGDVVTVKPGTAGVTITKIEYQKAVDKITLSTTLGAVIAIGGFVVEATSEGDSSALKYDPFSIVGTGKNVDPRGNFDTDAWVIGVTTGNELPDFIADSLKGIINY